MDASVEAKYSAVPQASKVSSGVNVLSELHALQLKLESMESALSTHQHIPVEQGAPAQCTSLIASTQVKAAQIVPNLLGLNHGNMTCTRKQAQSQHCRLGLKAAR